MEEDVKDNTPVPQEDVNPFENMTDEEIMELDESSLEALSSNNNSDADDESNEEKEELEEDLNSSDDTQEQDEEEEDTSEENELESEEDTTFSDQEDEFEEETPQKEEKSEEVDTKTEDDGINYKAEYEKIFKPFRANGVDVQVENADQAIRLMQMGAGFNKKMVQLKPALKVIKMLENNSLLDESKISYLIDLDKKDPKAIEKLIKDSGIDPLEVDVDKDPNYQPKSYAVTDAQVDLDQVLDDIQETSTYQTTINIITKQWDKKSQDYLVQEPENIKYINDQVASGIFDQINAEVQRQKVLGKLNGFSDIEAYRAVGTYMTENRLFKGLAQQQPSTPTEKTPERIPLPNKKSTTNPKLEKRKKAASSVKSKPTTSKKHDVNPLSLSDEDIEKLTI